VIRQREKNDDLPQRYPGVNDPRKTGCLECGAEAQATIRGRRKSHLSWEKPNRGGRERKKSKLAVKLDIDKAGCGTTVSSRLRYERGFTYEQWACVET
jgi:hypothetical protein